MSIDSNVLWLLSFYRSSEISGALFFGELARLLRPSAIQADLTRHFADEAQHARYWTECIEKLGARPLKIGVAYQDKYVSATGVPVNMMEILAITQVFERRVISQYALHRMVPGLEPDVKQTIERIMVDEQWHLKWIREALETLEPQYGAELIRSTLQRFTEADREVYQATAKEHEDRIRHLVLAQK